ncbi:MAG TPA: hypothetical protein VF170_17570 [Planctomycetaceae bacterium]
MGLTIHYALRSDAASEDEARRLVEALRQRALDLPFAKVGDLLEFRGRECDADRHEHPGHRWLLVQAVRSVWPEEVHREVAPEQVIAFVTDPGEGCEPAHFGLCRFPQAIREGGREVATGLSGWSWESFCKTQYASNPECGGIENFLRCHISVVGLLDRAGRLGMTVEADDESGFYDDRDVEALAAEVMRWNRGIAAFTGRLKDIFGDDFAAEITKYPNFERLEAEGRRDRSGDSHEAEP